MKWWKCETCAEPKDNSPPCFLTMPEECHAPEDCVLAKERKADAEWQPCGPAPHEPVKVDDTPLSVQMESLTMTVVRDNGEPEEITLKVKDATSVTAAEVNAQLRAQGIDPSMVASVTPMMAWTETEKRAERLQKQCEEWERCLVYILENGRGFKIEKRVHPFLNETEFVAICGEYSGCGETLFEAITNLVAHMASEG